LETLGEKRLPLGNVSGMRRKGSAKYNRNRAR